ncbi:MAG: acetate--CoA ligase family protein [Methanoregula sp.]|uniref:acetate--CoA ligase family protein n=1 Tax=Methanoregula sp. TaxID=2052170 RepID=UPI0025D71A92|nr:acetate--CoA ligase family protein [Methanoregula sp.]MCK9632686.1 acetate--CoA ligase family protein [Methanoregula sp.]
MTRTLLSEAEGYALLSTLSIPVPKHTITGSRDDAAQAADTMGYPVVMKIVSPDIVHKSDAGGVVTGIRSATEAREAFDRITRSVAAHNPVAKVSGIMVEQQMAPGLELIIGGKTDPAFGRVITVGLGGKMVELLRDVSIRVLPIDENEIRAMVRELKGYRLITGYRDEPARDEAALVAIIGSVAAFFLSDPHISEFDINPLVLYGKGACAVDARFYRDDAPATTPGVLVRNMPEGLLDIHSIAVVGASQDPNKVGYAICRNLLTFPGALYPVNPKAPMVLGRVAYPDLASIPGNVDLAVIAIPAPGVPGVIKEAGQKEVPLAIIISSGFREGGPEGSRLEEEILATAQKYGMRVMGPNCLGLMLPHKGINTTFDPVSPKPGRIAFISQSGAIITTIVDWSLPEEIGFSAVISVGNQSDLTFEDFIRYAGSDPDTRAIILYIEQIRFGTRFMDTVRRVSLTKPVVAIKAGSSRIGQKAASSHTGSLAGSHEVYMAAFHQAGVIPVSSIREAFETAELLSSEGYPRGTRAIVITNAGGFAVLSSDYAERFGIGIVEFSQELIGELDAVLPANWSRENPIDMVGDSSADRFARTFDIMIRHQDLWDIAFVIAVPSALSDPIRVANEIVRFSKHTHKMIVGCMIGGDSMKTPLRILRDSQIPNFPDLEDAFRAVGNVCRHRCSADTPECRHG